MIPAQPINTASDLRRNIVPLVIPGNDERPVTEPAGSSLQRASQILINERRNEIQATPGIASFGRSVAAFLPEFDTRGFASLIPQFKRVLVMGDNRALDAAGWPIRRAGATVTENMHFLEADQATFLPRALEKLSGRAGKNGVHHGSISADSSAAEIRAVQNLLQDSGLTPLPGALLRGHQGPVVTTTLLDPNDRLVATGTAIDLSGVGPSYANTAILLAGAVASDFQGQGLGSRLVAAMLVAAHNRLGATRAVGVVEAGNIRSLRMNVPFGLVVKQGIHARYVEASLLRG